MTNSTMRVIGLILLAAAVVLFLLNLQRVAGLGMNGLAIMLLIIGAILTIRSRKGR